METSTVRVSTRSIDILNKWCKERNLTSRMVLDLLINDIDRNETLRKLAHIVGAPGPGPGPTPPTPEQDEVDALVDSYAGQADGKNMSTQGRHVSCETSEEPYNSAGHPHDITYDGDPTDLMHLLSDEGDL